MVPEQHLQLQGGFGKKLLLVHLSGQDLCGVFCFANVECLMLLELPSDCFPGHSGRVLHRTHQPEDPSSLGSCAFCLPLSKLHDPTDSPDLSDHKTVGF